jgi:hypothetical protein
MECPKVGLLSQEVGILGIWREIRRERREGKASGESGRWVGEMGDLY